MHVGHMLPCCGVSSADYNAVPGCYSVHVTSWVAWAGKTDRRGRLSTLSDDRLAYLKTKPHTVT